MKTTHTGWWRCRIRCRTGNAPPWIYFTASANSEREFRREARFWAGLILRRQVFDIERCYENPPLNVAGNIGGKEFFYETMSHHAAEMAVKRG